MPAVEEAHLGSENDGDDNERDAQHDECLLSILYEVEADLFHFKGGSASAIGLEGGGGGGGVGGGGGLAGVPALGVFQELHGYDGLARLLWGHEVVAELTIDKAFLEAGRVEVLAYEAPTGIRYEYHLYTQPECGASWLPPQESTREEVEAREQ